MSEVQHIIFAGLIGRLKTKVGPLLDKALIVLGFFPQLTLMDKYADILHSFAVYAAELLEEIIPDETGSDVKLGPVRLARFDDLLEIAIRTNEQLSKEQDQEGIRDLAHWLLETYIAVQKAKGKWKPNAGPTTKP